MTKSEERKHFWIGFGKMSGSLLIGCTVGYFIGKLLATSNLF